MKYLIFILLIFSIFLFKGQEKTDPALESISKYLYENPDKAIEEGKKLIDSETDIDKKIRYYLYLSKAYTAKRSTDESLKTLLEAQNLLKTTNDLKSKIDVLINIAIQYQQMELFSKCFDALDEAESLCADLGPESDLQKNSWLGKSNAVKGIIYKSQGNNDIALEKFFSAVGFLEKAEQNNPTVNNLSIVYYNIGYSFFNLKNIPKAETYFQRSLQYATKSGAQSLQAFALKGLAESYTSQNNHQKALELLEQARQKSQKIGDLSLDEGIYKGLAENYLSAGEFERYLKNNEAYKKSKFGREQSELKSIDSFINNLENHYNQEVKKVNYTNFFIRVIILIIGLLASLFFISRIMKINKENKNKSEKIKELISK